MVVEPFEAMEKKVEVAVKSSVELAMEKTPERFLTRKCFWFSPASRSVSARAGVMDATCKVQLGVDVPIPTFPPNGWRRSELVLRAEPMVRLPDDEVMGPTKVEDEVLRTERLVMVVVPSCERPVTASEVEVALVKRAWVAVMNWVKKD